jgi:hypothetical protein
VALANPRTGFEPAHARQPYVQENQVEGLLAEPRQGRLARFSSLGYEAMVAQELDERARDMGVVFDDEDLGHGRSLERTSVALACETVNPPRVGLESSGVSMRNAVRGVTLATAAAAAVVAVVAAPRVLWQNAGPRVDYPWPAAAAALLGALVLAGLASSLGPRGRTLALASALALALRAGHLFAYVVTATEEGIIQRDLTGSASVAWREIIRVDLEPAHIVVQGRNGTLRIPTHRISGEDRARLERTVSRRVRQATSVGSP